MTSPGRSVTMTLAATPTHAGCRACAPRLYFLGLLWQHTRGSALLGWVKDDAQFIAQHIDALARSRATSRTLLTSAAGSR